MNPEGSTYKYTQHNAMQNAQKMQMIYEKFLKFHSKKRAFFTLKSVHEHKNIKLYFIFVLFAQKQPTEHPDGFTQKLELNRCKTLSFQSSKIKTNFKWGYHENFIRIINLPGVTVYCNVCFKSS